MIVISNVFPLHFKEPSLLDLKVMFFVVTIKVVQSILNSINAYFGNSFVCVRDRVERFIVALE